MPDRKIAARENVSEVGLDVDRAKLIRRYRDEGLTQKEIGEGLELGQSMIGKLLIYDRYIASNTDGTTRLSESAFRAFWHQVADPALTKGRREPDLAALQKVVDEAPDEKARLKAEARLQAAFQGRAPPRGELDGNCVVIILQVFGRALLELHQCLLAVPPSPRVSARAGGATEDDDDELRVRL